MSSEARVSLDGKHAVVTGGGRGIGLAIVGALAARGARVSVASRAPGELHLKLHDGSYHPFVTAIDVTSEEQVASGFERCRAANGPIEILVNNSGIAESAPLSRTSLAMWERIVATNMTGTFLCTRAVTGEMQSARWGRIVNVASIAGLGGAPYISAYCASKHGVVGFTRAIAAEFDGSGITCNAVCPGYTETEMLRRATENIVKYTGASEESARERLAKSNPGGRIATVQDVAGAVLDLVTGSRNGVAVIVPGGTSA